MRRMKVLKVVPNLDSTAKSIMADLELLSHFMEKRKNNDKNTNKNNRFPPTGGTLNIAASSNGRLLQNIANHIKMYILHKLSLCRKIHAADIMSSIEG